MKHISHGSHRISILDILDSSLVLYLRKMPAFFIIFLLVNTVSAFLFWIASPFIPKLNLQTISIDEFLVQLINYGVYLLSSLLPIFLVSWIIIHVGGSIVMSYTIRIYEGGEIGIGEIIEKMPHFLGRIIAISFLVGALTITGFILLVFPGIIMLVVFSLAIPASISENLGVFESLRRSRLLIEGFWWKAFLLFLSIFALLLVAILLADLSLFLFQPAYRSLKALIRVIMISLIEPIYPISIANFYNHIKRLKVPPEIKVWEHMPSRALETEVKICYNCGQILPYDAVYCPNCGVKVR